MSSSNNGYYSKGAYDWELIQNKSALSEDLKDSDEIDLRHHFYLLWAHKWLIVISVLFCVMAAGLVAFIKTPVYHSSGSMMINKSQNQYSYAGSDLASLLTNSYGIGIGNSISDELQILQSRKLSKEIADTLRELRKMQNGRQYPVLFNDYPDDSTLAAEKVVVSRLRQNLAFQQYTKSIQPIVTESHLINIFFQSPSPLEARKVVNLTMEKYNRLSSRQNRKSANAAVNFLANEKARIQKKLHKAENNLQKYMDKSSLVQIDAQTTSLINRIANLQQRLQKARTNLEATNTAIAQYQARLNNIKPGLADQYANAIGPNMNRLQYQLAEFKTERMKLLSKNPQLKMSAKPPQKLRDLNRQIKDYQNKIRLTTRNLLKKGDQYLTFLGSDSDDMTSRVSELQGKLIELKVRQQQYQSQEKVLSKEINNLDKRFNKLPQNMISLARLKRKVQLNQSLYETVSKQYAQMALWRQTQFGKGQVVDEGYVPTNPIKPNTPLYLLTGFAIGLIISVGYVFTSEAFNASIDGIKKLKDLGVPVLSLIPDIQLYIDKKYDGRQNSMVNRNGLSPLLISAFDALSPVTESFRRLENNILHAKSNKELKSLLITSTGKGEGKTTIITNLGVVMAEAEQRVILVDTDLRRPNLHSMFDFDRSPGIPEILSNEVSLQESVKQTAIPNLSILPAGDRPSNPSAIMKSNGFKQLIKKLMQKYDKVLIDSPPFGIIADSSSLVDEMSGVAVVCRFNETGAGKLQYTLNQLGKIDAPIIGTILNAFNPGTSSDHYYGQNYHRDLFQDYARYEESD